VAGISQYASRWEEFLTMNRRVFLGSALGATAFGQNRPLKLGLIGAGWFGMVDVDAAFKAGGIEVVAVADADTTHLDEASAAIEKLQGSKPKLTKDYREVIATSGLDGVIIATPPHWHALPFIAACQKGLAIYCEKPLAYDIREGRAMANAAKKAGNLVAIGFQRRTSDAFQQVREYVRAGNAGRIVQVDVQIHYTAALLDNKPQDPPAGLDWELWCGPAPKLPYSPQVGHKSWRLEEAYGNGHLVDWGIHLMDATRMMLDLGMPTSVEAAGGIYEYKGRITTPDTLTAYFEFESCPVVWRHRLWGAQEYTPETNNGVTLFGDKQTIFVSDNRWVVIPREKGAQRRVTDVTGDLSQRSLAAWVNAVRTKGPVPCTVEEAFQSTATVQLGMIAYKTGKRVEWDARSEKIVNDSAANQRLTRPYRAPYKHPYA
jgi:predicted dehydrogenase